MNNAEFDQLIQMAHDAGLICKAYPAQWLLNITDPDGTVQSYYASTRTAIFRDGNDKYRSKKHTERNFPYGRFIALCIGEGDDDILDFFKEDWMR